MKSKLLLPGLLLWALLSFHCSTSRFQEDEKEEKLPPENRYEDNEQEKEQEIIPKNDLWDDETEWQDVEFTVESPLIRVLLEEKSGTVSFTAEKSLYIEGDSQLKFIVNEGDAIVVKGSGTSVSLSINGSANISASFTVSAGDGSDIVSYGSKDYRGTITFVKKGGSLLIINMLSLENYVRGVVPLEIGVGIYKKYYEALKAAAICARTYAYSKMKANAKLYDVTDDTRDQVYGGYDVETPHDDNAVYETQGMIVTYEGIPAQTLYSSCCGGEIESSTNVFNKYFIPYLREKEDGNPSWCKDAPVYSWKETYTPADINRLMINAGLVKKSELELTEITITETYESGRVKFVNVTFAGIHTVTIPSRDLRGVFRRKNNEYLRSTLFTIETMRDGGEITEIILNGNGYGHGVGLCQWGALGMSAQGKRYEEILEWYYPGTAVQQIKNG